MPSPRQHDAPSAPLPPHFDLAPPPAEGNRDRCKIKAKGYQRKKKMIEMFLLQRMNLENVGMQVQQMKSMESMSSAMRNTTRMMTSLNKKMKSSQMDSIMQTFMRENNIMQDQSDMQGEMLEEAMTGENDEVCAGVVWGGVG